AQFDGARACFVPGKSVQAERSAGSCNGSFSLNECLREGIATGAVATQTLGYGNGSMHITPPVVEAEKEQPLQATWLVPSRFPLGRGPKQFVDFQNDTSAADIQMAARENYQSIEHIKRYTLLGFGTDQGKISNVNGIGILAQCVGIDMASVG